MDDGNLEKKSNSTQIDMKNSNDNPHINALYSTKHINLSFLPFNRSIFSFFNLKPLSEVENHQRVQEKLNYDINSYSNTNDNKHENIVRSPLYIADPDLRNTLAGAGAGIISAIIVCPLDVLKLRIQSQSTPKGGIPKYKGTFSGLRLIWKEEGIRGLFRGLPITCMSYIADRAIWFGCYHRFTQYFHESFEKNNSNYPPQFTPLLSTISASIICMTLGNPFWVVRARWMIQPTCSSISGGANYPKLSVRYSSIPDVFSKMYTHEGARSFYNGFVPSLFGVFHVAVQFPLYEYMKVFMINAKSRNSPDVTRIYADEKNSESLSGLEILFASATSKMIASVTTYPHEVIRTRLQIQQISPKNSNSLDAPILNTKKQGIISIVKKIFREEGKLGFYRGLSTNLIRTVPASALSLWGFEELRKEFSR